MRRRHQQHFCRNAADDDSDDDNNDDDDVDYDDDDDHDDDHDDGTNVLNIHTTRTLNHTIEILYTHTADTS